MGERGLQLGHLDRTVGQAGRLGGEPGGRRVVERPERGVVALGPVVEAGDVGRTLDQPAGAVPGGQHHGGRPVGDGGHVVPAQRLADVVLGQQGIDVALAPGPHGHLGHRALVGDPASITARAWRAAKVRGSAPSGSEEVGVHLHRVDQRRVAGGGSARTGDDGDLDVALLQPEPRLVQRPGAVHLDVRVPLGWPRPDGVEVRDERERLAGDVVATARGR